jgi:hypothetical protein
MYRTCRPVGMAVLLVSAGCVMWHEAVGHEPTDAPTDDGGVPASELACSQAEDQRATVQGATPLGPIHTSTLVHAFTGGGLWGGPVCGQQLSVVLTTGSVLHFTEPPTQPLPAPLQLHLIYELQAPVSLETVVPVHAILYNGDDIAETDGTLRLGQLVERTGLLSGDFALESSDDGWDVQGAFQAQHCRLLEDSCL